MMTSSIYTKINHVLQSTERGDIIKDLQKKLSGPRNPFSN